MESNAVSPDLIKAKKLSVLYLTLLLAGIIVSIYLAQKLDSTNKDLIRERNNLRITKDSLVAAQDSLLKVNTAYLKARDSIAMLATLMNDLYVRKDAPLVYEQNKKTIETITQPPQSKYMSARNLEIQGFNYLLANDLTNALNAFKSVDSIYPAFHCTMEIYNLLKKNKNKLSNEATIREIKKTILSKYTYGAPDSLLQKMKKQVQ